MPLNRRRVLLAGLALPTGCALQSLEPLSRTPIPPPEASGALRAPVVGQSWTYRKLNFFNSAVLDEVVETIASVGSTVVVQRQSASGAALPEERHAAWGQLWRDAAWDYPMTFEEPVPLWPTELMPGAKSAVTTHYRMDGGSFRYWIQVHSVVHGGERITVSAGTFDTLRIERLMRLDHEDHTRLSTLRRDTMWLSPEVGRWVARETSGRYWLSGDGWLRQTESLEDHLRWELSAWH